nr:MAG TPA: General transcription and DNA repair polymerase ii, transcription initiation [Caudoviricetes sp.]
MITIKRNGSMHYFGVCPECNAEFEFDKTDIIDGKIWCPQCGTESKTEITVKLYREIKEEMNERLRKALFADCVNAFPKIKTEEVDSEQNQERKQKKIWQKWKSK